MPKLSRSASYEFRRVIHFLCWESVFAVAFEAWMSPALLSGLAGQLHLKVEYLSWIAAIPWIGSVGQILGVVAFQRSRSVKTYVLTLAALGRLIWFLPLVAAGFWVSKSWVSQVQADGASVGKSLEFPVLSWLFLVAVCSCFSSLFNAASMNAWMVWVRHLLPMKFQGRFFGYRQRFTTAAIILANFFAALFVDWTHHGYYLGLVLLCVAALVCGGVSLALNAKVRDVEAESLPMQQARSIGETLKEPFFDPHFRSFLIFGALFNGILQLASSYYPYYFTKALGLPLRSLMIWTALASLGCFFASNFWGRRVDQTGLPYRVLGLNALGIAVSPVLYALGGVSWVQWMAPFEYLLSGLVWAGFLLAQTKILFRLSPSSHASATYFSVYATLSGLSGGVFTFLGGMLIHFFELHHQFPLFWVLATVLRLLVLALFYPLLSNPP
ncbi:MAG: MFS transporter [Bdellovibrionia bacterium]